MGTLNHRAAPSARAAQRALHQPALQAGQAGHREEAREHVSLLGLLRTTGGGCDSGDLLPHSPAGRESKVKAREQ